MPIRTPIHHVARLTDARGIWGQYVDGRIELDANLSPEQRERVLRHELTHARQHADSGLSWRAWFAEYQRIEREVGYLNHPWEIEARKAERITCPYHSTN